MELSIKDIKQIITKMVGHSNINTTRMYLNIDADTLREIALEVPHMKQYHTFDFPKMKSA